MPPGIVLIICHSEPYKGEESLVFVYALYGLSDDEIKIVEGK